MKLVITEKPSVAKSIASALGVTSRADGYFEGNGYLISWCIGHLVGLADAAAYDDRYKKWRYEDLPILPAPFRYVVSEEKAAQFHILRSLMERPDVTELVNACDAGREGELIFRLVYKAAGCSKPFSRLWISSMEDAAIRDGFADLRPGADYDPLYQSALCRQKADWLIGINASRLFSVLYHRTLNVGRVQTPTLAMLADRDSKIVLFRKEKYHHVRLTLEGAEAVSDRIVSPKDAQAIRDACDGKKATCVSLVREKKTEKPPKLYDLTTLQREANRVFGYTAKQTLDYAQSLYEKKLLTYLAFNQSYAAGTGGGLIWLIKHMFLQAYQTLLGTPVVAVSVLGGFLGLCGIKGGSLWWRGSICGAMAALGAATFVGRVMLYNLLPLMLFAFFGVLALVCCVPERIYWGGQVAYLLCAGLFVVVIAQNQTIFYKPLFCSKTLTCQQQIAQQIRSGPIQNPSLLEAGMLNRGFYNELGVIPSIYYFYLPNVSYDEHPEILDCQLSYILAEETDYVVLQGDTPEISLQNLPQEEAIARLFQATFAHYNLKCVVPGTGAVDHLYYYLFGAES